MKKPPCSCPKEDFYSSANPFEQQVNAMQNQILMLCQENNRLQQNLQQTQQVFGVFKNFNFNIEKYSLFRISKRQVAQINRLLVLRPFVVKEEVFVRLTWKHVYKNIQQQLNNSLFFRLK